MQCRNCGTLFYTPYCHNCGASANSNKKKDTIFHKWWFWLLLVVILCLSVSLYKTNRKLSEETSSTTSSTTENSTPTDNQYRIGDVLDANGLQITLVSAEKWTDYSEWDTPQNGYMYVRVKATFQNNASADREVDSGFFSCYADDQKQSKFLFATDELAYGMLSPGRKTEGYLYYSVPITAEDIELEYTSFDWNGQRAVFVLDNIK